MKVLVASKKCYAVNIIYEKVTKILSEPTCLLYIFEDQQTKQNTCKIIIRLLSKVTSYQTTSEEVNSKNHLLT